MLLNWLLEDDVEKTMEDFHKWDCGGNLFWKTTTKKVLRVVFYRKTLFVYVYKKVSSHRECQIFEGRKKFLSLTLKFIVVESPFQQWGLDFIGEIHHK